MLLNTKKTPIEGVVVIETRSMKDMRGSFMRLFCEAELGEILGDRHLVQINHSRTIAAGTVRGMHYQYPPYAEMKFIRCLKGKVWDVAVDLRAKSPTFLTWHAEELSEENTRMLIIPEGCAHGFQTLEADSTLLYLHTAAYAADYEGGVRYDDPRLQISWPMKPVGLSERDRKYPIIHADYSGLML